MLEIDIPEHPGVSVSLTPAQARQLASGLATGLLSVGGRPYEIRSPLPESAPPAIGRTVSYLFRGPDAGPQP